MNRDGSNTHFKEIDTLREIAKGFDCYCELVSHFIRLSDDAGIFLMTRVRYALPGPIIIRNKYGKALCFVYDIGNETILRTFATGDPRMQSCSSRKMLENLQSNCI